MASSETSRDGAIAPRRASSNGAEIDAAARRKAMELPPMDAATAARVAQHLLAAREELARRDAAGGAT